MGNEDSAADTLWNKERNNNSTNLDVTPDVNSLQNSLLWKPVVTSYEHTRISAACTPTTEMSSKTNDVPHLPDHVDSKDTPEDTCTIWKKDHLVSIGNGTFSSPSSLASPSPYRHPPENTVPPVQCEPPPTRKPLLATQSPWTPLHSSTKWTAVAQLASLGVGMGPGVNPNMCSNSGISASSINNPPIVNTGNNGPMCVQPGDWVCSTCGFVNWRRRKVCMRCYPFADSNEMAHSIANGAVLAAQLAAGVDPSPEAIASLTMSRRALTSHTSTPNVLHTSPTPLLPSSTSTAPETSIHVSSGHTPRIRKGSLQSKLPIETNNNSINISDLEELLSKTMWLRKANTIPSTPTSQSSRSLPSVTASDMPMSKSIDKNPEKCEQTSSIWNDTDLPITPYPVDSKRPASKPCCHAYAPKEIGLPTLTSLPDAEKPEAGAKTIITKDKLSTLAPRQEGDWDRVSLQTARPTSWSRNLDYATSGKESKSFPTSPLSAHWRIPTSDTRTHLTSAACEHDEIVVPSAQERRAQRQPICPSSRGRVSQHEPDTIQQPSM